MMVQQYIQVHLYQNAAAIENRVPNWMQTQNFNVKKQITSPAFVALG
jgi:hypothetical protein